MSLRSLVLVTPLVAGLALVQQGLVSAAQTADSQPVIQRADDSGLQWAPCPAVFPKGCEVTVLQGDPAAGRSDVFLRSPANYTFPPHKHTSPERIVLVSGEMEMTYAGKAPVVVSAGGYTFVPGSMPHAARCLAKGPCVMFIAFQSPIDAEAAELTGGSGQQ